MRVLSGIQPSGQLHLGNYFGSIRPNLEYVRKADESFFFVADLHALTTISDPEELRKAREEIVLDYLACGFDPEKAILYFQSDIPEHTQLMWILSCVSPMGLLERAVSFKEKVGKGITASVGLFNYPILMAADILLYDADIVPVGRDQQQHVEITRDIAIKFNNAFGETLTIPKAEIRKESAVVPGTDGQKMSKSYGNTIPLFGEEKSIKNAVMSIVTDSKEEESAKEPETCTVYRIHTLFLSPEESKALADEYRGGLSYGDAKKRLFAAVMDTFGPMREKREVLKKNPNIISEIMQQGALKASIVAKETIARVRKAVGLHE